MLQVNLLRRKRFYRNLLLISVLVAILRLNSISLLMVPHYTDSNDPAFWGIRDRIWSNESVPILSPRDACSLQPNTSIPKIMVMVPSALMNFERRAAIRNSWADTPLVREGKMKVIFILGQKLRRRGASQVLFFQRVLSWVAWITFLSKATSIWFTQSIGPFLKVPWRSKEVKWKCLIEG